MHTLLSLVLFSFCALNAMQQEDVEQSPPLVSINLIPFGFQTYLYASHHKLPPQDPSNPILPSCDVTGKTGLMYAAEQEDIFVLANLVQAGANINQVDTIGWSALFYAMYENKRLAVDYLLKNGAHTHLKDKKGETAIAYSSSDLIKAIWKDYTQPKLSLYPIRQSEFSHASIVGRARVHDTDKIYTHKRDQGAAELNQYVAKRRPEVDTDSEEEPDVFLDYNPMDIRLNKNEGQFSGMN